AVTGSFHGVIDRYRLLSSPLNNLGLDRCPLILGTDVRRVNLDNLITIISQRIGISSHQQGTKFSDQHFLLLGSRSRPVFAHRQLGHTSEIEMRQYLFPDEAQYSVLITRFDSIILFEN